MDRRSGNNRWSNSEPKTRRRRAYRATLAASVLAVLLCAAIAYTASPTQSATALSVRAFGATGNGRTDDTKAFKRAMRAAVNARATLYVPRGTYKLRPLGLPDGLKIKGASSNGSWLKGHITFGSNTVVRDLKLGDAGWATHNRANASNTLFERCQFRGGGGAIPESCVLRLGLPNSCSHITFKDCDFERNLGTGDGYTGGYNTIDITEDGRSAGGAHVDSITFDGCHIGVSNGAAGRNIGSPRAGIEMYTWTGSSSTAAHGWSNMVIKDCVFEATNSFCIDLADKPLANGQRAAGPVTIRGCLIKGGGYTDGNSLYGSSIDLEAPRGVLIENNTIYRGYSYTVVTSVNSGVSPGYIIRNNNIDMAYDNGITPRDSIYNWYCEFGGDGGTVTGNTFTVNQAGEPLMIDGMTNGTVTGNTFIEKRASGGAWPLVYQNSADTVITGNTFSTAATSNAMNIMRDGGNNASVTRAPNTFLHN